MALDKSYNLIIGTPDSKPGSPTKVDPASSENPPTLDPTFATNGIQPDIADPSIGIAPAFAGVMISSAKDLPPYNPGLTATPADGALETASSGVVTPNLSDGIVSGPAGSLGEGPATPSGTLVKLASTSGTLASGATGQSIGGTATDTGSTAVSPASSANGPETSDNGADNTASASLTGTSATATKSIQAGQAAVGRGLETYMKGIIGFQVIFAMII